MAMSSSSVLLGTTEFKFSSPAGTDTMLKDGVTTSILTRLHCITVMKVYENKSLEELRLEDYMLKKKANVTSSAVTDLSKGASNSSTKFVMSNPALFGSSNSTTTSSDSTIAFEFSNPAKTSTVSNTGSIFPVLYPFNKSTLRPLPNPATRTAKFPVRRRTASTSFRFSNPITATTLTLFNPATTATFTFANSSTTAFTFSNPTATTFTSSNPASTFPNATTTPNIFQFGLAETSVQEVDSRSIGYDATTKKMEQLESNTNALQKGDTPLFIESSTQTEEELNVCTLHQGLKEMLLNSKHSDFVLNVKGMEFRVHKIILAAQSPVFAAMLEHDTKEKADGIANINDCKPLTITKFLNFLYTGRLENLNSDNVLDLYVVADKYQVAELSSLCIKYMKNNVSIENFCDILSLSLRHHVRELIEVATQFFLQNSTKIAITAKWTTFLDQNPVAGNELFLKALNLKKE